MINLNLLPAQLKKAAHQSLEFSRWQPAMLMITFSSIIIFMATFFIHSLLSVHGQSIKAQFTASQTTSTKRTGDITAQTSQLNTTTASLATGLTKPRSWANDLGKIIAILPADVTLTSINLTSDGHIKIDGTAKTRLAFLSLQTTLTSSPLLKNVTTTSTASKRDNVPFSYSAVLP